MTFPPESWVYWYHVEHGWISPDAARSLPVHPLQAYFVAAALLCLLASMIGRDRAEGTSQLAFYSLFFVSTAVLEPLRENPLTLNRIVVWPLAAAFVALSAYRLMSRRDLTLASA